MNLYLIRHGQTKGNAEGRYLGAFDDELSESGKEEIHVLKELIRDVSFDKVFSSEKSRAFNSANILFDGKINIDSRLNERNFGIFENMTYKEIGEKYPSERVAWENDWIDYKICEGESVSEVYNRVVDFLKSIEKESYNNCIIVSHGGIIRLIYCYILGGDLNNFWRFSSRNGNISVVKYEYGNWYIDSIT